jgi:hypothetical protein
MWEPHPLATLRVSTAFTEITWLLAEEAVVAILAAIVVTSVIPTKMA